MRKLYLIGLILLLSIVVACNQDEEVQVEEEDDDVEIEEDEEEEEVVATPQYVYPLTGEETDAEVTNRALAVMVNNHTAARPQTGLVNADIVYEFLAEGPITRFLAIYHSDIPEVVGPVRSARSYYIETAKAHDAIYIYHGAANFIEDDLRAGWVENLNGAYYDNDGFLFKRESFRQAPHNSYVLLENAYEVATRNNIAKEMDHEPWDFLSESDVVNGEDANDINIFYYNQLNVSFSYNPSNEQYTRYSDGTMSVDLNTEEPVEVANILIYETEHRVIDDASRRFIDRESGGRGYLIQKGKIQEIEWRNVNGLMKPFIDGEIAKLAPGKTWVNIIPLSPGLDEAVTYE